MKALQYVAYASFTPSVGNKSVNIHRTSPWQRCSSKDDQQCSDTAEHLGQW